ncbi:uncharacterized protein DNG_02883 [Cephalotrichum gorgonifer]|uniref:Uncharacterized protein n=1 Tax=Cephalotrichum gorgonifer TaxID=2041049 RepID=A0AAE8MU14_9PEZI|nr:uncharacterized protein DNG_02883 [Cephalotrichum gorgonifer]
MALDAFLRLSVLAIHQPVRDLRIDLATTADPDRHSTLSVVVRHGDYTLLGCYVGLRSGTELEVFEEDGYITLIPVPRDKSTVSLCIEGCAKSVPGGTSDENYPHVAVSEGRYLCGVSLSEWMSPIKIRLCDTPCDGDPASPTIPSSREDTPDDQLPPEMIEAVLLLADTKSTVAVVVASVICAVVLATLALLLCILFRRRRRRPESNPGETTLERDGRDEKAAAAPRAYITKGPIPQLDTSAAHWHTHTSAPTSGSDSRRQSHVVQEDDSSAAGDTEPSGTASPTILSVSHVVGRPVAGGVLIVDTSGQDRRYSMPVSATRGGLRRPSARG